VSALAATVVLALLLHFPGASVADELVANHVRSLLASHLVDIETSDRQIIKPWFMGKVDFSPPIPELAEQGFPLVGGRLDYMPGRVLPAVVYRRGQHIINVFVWPAGGRTAAPVTTRRDGYNVLGWSQGSLRFCAVSDAEPAALSQLKAAIAQQVRD
jgi:anti-sigma factor RsiW